MSNPLSRPLDLEWIEPENSVLTLRFLRAQHTDKGEDLIPEDEVNYIYKFLHGDDMAMTFEELPERAQQIILNAEAKKK